MTSKHIIIYEQENMRNGSSVDDSLAPE